MESYKLLRKLFTDTKKADPAWCLCQALSVLRLAEPDEERFYKKHRSENAAPAQAALDEDAWNALMHWDLDPLVTRIFAMIQPTIIRARTQPIENMGYDPRYAIDCSMHPYPVSQTLYYVGGVLGMAPPLVFQNPNDPGSLGMVHARTPAIVLGRAAFENTAADAVAGVHRGPPHGLLPPWLLRPSPRADRHRAEGVALRGDQAVRPAVPGVRRPPGSGRRGDGGDGSGLPGRARRTCSRASSRSSSRRAARST